MIKYVLLLLIIFLIIYTLLRSSNGSSISDNAVEKFVSDNLTNSSQKNMAENYYDNNKTVVCESENVKECVNGKCGIDHLYPILEATFNLRETSKQCLLLEDHLNNNKKRCYDCLKKHFLIVDGLIEEAIGLELNNELREEYRKLLLDWIKIEKKYAQNQNNPNILDEISKDIRLFRKPLVEKYFDTVSDYNV